MLLGRNSGRIDGDCSETASTVPNGGWEATPSGSDETGGMRRFESTRNCFPEAGTEFLSPASGEQFHAGALGLRVADLSSLSDMYVDDVVGSE